MNKINLPTAIALKSKLAVDLREELEENSGFTKETANMLLNIFQYVLEYLMETEKPLDTIKI